jgi:hypothetical protein
VKQQVWYTPPLCSATPPNSPTSPRSEALPRNFTERQSSATRVEGHFLANTTAPQSVKESYGILHGNTPRNPHFHRLCARQEIGSTTMDAHQGSHCRILVSVDVVSQLRKSLQIRIWSFKLVCGASEQRQSPPGGTTHESCHRLDQPQHGPMGPHEHHR